jgi:5,10-methylene-tetrahydrofolate dehydrogenase/methenyl tetrahydrofolate cyclohydrolase
VATAKRIDGRRVAAEVTHQLALRGRQDQRRDRGSGPMTRAMLLTDIVEIGERRLPVESA